MTGSPNFNAQIYEEAIDWFVRMRDGENDVAARAELTAWLRRSPEHVRAYLETASIWTEVRGVRAERVGDAETLIERALARGNVHELPSIPRRGPESTDINVPAGEDARHSTVPAMPAAQGSATVTPSRASRRRFAIAASVLLAALTLGLLTWYRLDTGTYSTGTGEQKAIALADGSRVELNSQSSIRIRFTDEARMVDLREGQALFQVAKDPSRPFIVRSEEAQVRAVGTSFDVYRNETGTLVTVVEGKVRVDRRAKALGVADPGSMPRPRARSDGSGAAPSLPASPQRGTRQSGEAVELVAGEQVLVTAQVLEAPRTVNVSSATAWTQQKLVFESASLGDVAREFNRYNTRPLVVRAGQLEDFRISAVFPSTDPASLIRFLREQPGIRVEETREAILISSSGAAK